MCEPEKQEKAFIYSTTLMDLVSISSGNNMGDLQGFL